MLKLSTAAVGAIGALGALLYACPAAAQSPVECIGDFDGTRARGNVRMNLDCAFVRGRPRASRTSRTQVRVRRPAREEEVLYEPGPRYGRAPAPAYYDYDDEEAILLERPRRPRVFIEAEPYGAWDWCPLGFLFGRW